MSPFQSDPANLAPEPTTSAAGHDRDAASRLHDSAGRRMARRLLSRPRKIRWARIRRSMFAAAAIATVVGPPVVATPSASAVTGLQYAQRMSANDSTAEKVVYVPCPTGTRAIGGSAVIGGTTRVRVNTEVPDAFGYTVLAREPEGGVSESWYVVVTAQCAPATSLPGLEYRRVDSVFDSATTHGATAACSPGKKLIGAGGLLDSNGSGQDNLVLTAVRPALDLSSVRVSGSEDETGYAGNWRASATAVCVSPVPGQQVASSSSPVDSTSFKRATATCPAGTKIHSGGFDIGSGDGEVNLATFFLDPDVSGDPSRQGFEAQAREDHTGQTDTWRVAAFAICAN